MLPRDDREDVPFLETVVHADLLSGEDRGLPHTFAYRNFFGCPVDGVRDLAHGRPLADDQRLPKVRLLPLGLQVHPHEPEEL